MRTPVLATARADHAFVRTVILRDVSLDEDILFFFTDLRSSKVAQLEKNKKSSLLFYEYVKNLQLRVNGEVTVHAHDEVAQKYWDTVPVKSRFNYAARPGPGSELPAPGDGLAGPWRGQVDPLESEEAFAHFAVLAFRAQALELLHLHPGGHRRAAYRRTPEGYWEGRWLVP